MFADKSICTFLVSHGIKEGISTIQYCSLYSCLVWFLQYIGHITTRSKNTPRLQHPSKRLRVRWRSGDVGGHQCGKLWTIGDDRGDLCVVVVVWYEMGSVYAYTRIDCRIYV